MSPRRPKLHQNEEVIDRVLISLYAEIKRKGFTQLQVQRQLGWGRTYISQLFRKQKGLRLDQVLAILHVIEVSPGEFFREMFPHPPRSGAFGDHLAPEEPVFDVFAPLLSESTDKVVVAIAEMLIAKGYLNAEELISAVRSLGTRQEGSEA